MEYQFEDVLNTCPSMGDTALYVLVSDGALEGVIWISIDDKLNTGTPLCYDKVTEKSLNRFYYKLHVYNEFEFFGSKV